jgi:hypothetical protein
MSGPRSGTGVDWLVARVVHQAGRRVGFAELADLCGELPKATLSRALRRLEARDVVRVGVDPSDRRLRVIAPGDVRPDAVPAPDLSSARAQVEFAAASEVAS